MVEGQRLTEQKLTGKELTDFILKYDTQQLRSSPEKERIAASGAILNGLDAAVDRYLQSKENLLPSSPVLYGLRVALELHPNLSTESWVHGIATRYNLKQDNGGKIREVFYYVQGEQKNLKVGGN